MGSKECGVCKKNFCSNCICENFPVRGPDVEEEQSKGLLKSLVVRPVTSVASNVVKPMKAVTKHVQDIFRSNEKDLAKEFDFSSESTQLRVHICGDCMFFLDSIQEEKHSAKKQWNVQLVLDL